MLLRREGNALVPVNGTSRDALAKIKPGAIVAADVRRPRNLKHLRKFWTMIDVIFEAQSHFATKERMVDAIKIASGHFVTWRMPDGREVVEPDSISFAELSQDGFEEFYDRAVGILLTQILPNCDRADIEARVLDILNGPQRAAA